jgi:hypothetical protein
MSIFSGSGHINANHGIFNTVAGGQVNFHTHNYGPVTIQCLSSSPLPQSPYRPSHQPSSLLSRPISGPGVLFTEGPVVPCHFNFSAAVNAAIEGTIGLIIKIVDLLTNRRVPSNIHLVPELKLLQHTLILNKLAIQAYSDNPLGRSLANTIHPAVEWSNVVLHKILDRLGSTWLHSISVSDVWGSVWRNGWDEDELLLWKKEVCEIRSPLGEVLLALNS